MAAFRRYLENEHRVMRYIDQQLTQIWHNLEHLDSTIGQRNSNLARRRRVSDEQIESLPSVAVTYREVDARTACSVCLDDFIGGKLVKQLPCKHIFHNKCIKSWLESHNTCPLCRGQVFEENSNDNIQSPIDERLQQTEEQPAQQQRPYRRIVRYIPARYSPSRSATARNSNRSQLNRRRRTVITSYTSETENSQNQ